MGFKEWQELWNKLGGTKRLMELYVGIKPKKRKKLGKLVYWKRYDI